MRCPALKVHDAIAHGAVPDHQRGIGSDPLLLVLGLLIAYRQRRASVLVHHGQRDPLRDHVHVVTKVHVAEAAIAVRMDIDEARRQIFAGDIDRPRRLRRAEVTDCRNASLFDRHVGDEPRIAGAIEHASSADEEIELCNLPRGSWFPPSRAEFLRALARPRRSSSHLSMRDERRRASLEKPMATAMLYERRATTHKLR